MTAMSEAFEHPQMCRGVSFVRVVLAFSFFGRSFHLSEAFEGYRSIVLLLAIRLVFSQVGLYPLLLLE